MAILTKKEARKLKGKYYSYSSGKQNYVFTIKSAHKTYHSGVKVVITKAFASVVSGIIIIDSLHQNNFVEITKEEFELVLADADKIRSNYYD